MCLATSPFRAREHLTDYYVLGREEEEVGLRSRCGLAYIHITILDIASYDGPVITVGMDS